ncbi:MAG: hypothetical protein KME59_23000 [Trichormus sp. ATA11-4-KO1]|jgi:hypothetical protein|nr:hypothetical protein [Trichormus sp. ATA11-4-KO1]
MNKPLEYYTSVTPGDGSLLDKLQNEYGSTFEKLSRLEKLYIVGLLITNLVMNEADAITADREAANQAKVHAAITATKFRNLPIKEHLGLVDAIVNQLKYHGYKN